MTHWRGVIYIGIAVALWSTAEVVIRVVQQDIMPVQLAWIRFTGGAFMMLVLLPFDERGRQALSPKLIFHGAWMAIFGIMVNAICFQYALKYAGAGVVATGFGAAPVMVFLLSRIVNGEPLSLGRGMGILCGFIGLAILGLSKESNYFSYKGLALTMASVVSLSVFTVSIKRFVGDFAGLPLTAVTFAFGALYLLPLAMLEVPDGLLSGVLEHWHAVAYLSWITTGLAYLLYFKGLMCIDATSASSIILLKPPAAALIAWQWAGEPLTFNLAFAIVFIVGGLYLVIFLDRRRQKHIECNT